MNSRILSLAAVFIGGPFVACASTTLSFSLLSQSGSGSSTEGATYTQQGFTFSSSGSVAAWNASNPNLPSLNVADTSLFQYYAGTITSISNAGAVPFTVDSIDLAPLLAGGTGSFNVTFTGTFADSSTVSQTFTVSYSTPAVLKTFNFSGFTNIISLSFKQGTNIGFFAEQNTAYQFDNLVISSPVITSSVNGASFQAPIVPNSWATILGGSLATVTDTWDRFILNGQLPATVDGVSVQIGGQEAYLYYISESQINLVVPDVGPGPQQVVVTNSLGSSAVFTATSASYGPALFPWPNSQVVATRQDFSIAAQTGTFSGLTTIPAKPGDVIILWGTGFGPTNPVAPVGMEVPSDQIYSTSTLPTVTINNVAATVYGAALAPGYAGLYQVAIQVPASLANGDWPVTASIGGVISPSGMVLTVQK